MTAYIDIIAGTGGIIGQDVNATIEAILHTAAPQLGDEMVPLVQAKTPVETGALQADVTYETYATGDDDLLLVYSDTGEQIAAWDRVYVEYQEGGPLGLATYTNDPRMMYLLTAEGDGLVLTQSWAEFFIQEALDLCVAGGGIPI